MLLYDVTQSAQMLVSSGGIASTPISAWNPAYSPGTTAEGWHSLTPYLATGWAAVSGWHAPQYRLTNTGDIQLTGAVSGTIASASQNIAVMPTGYYGADGLISNGGAGIISSAGFLTGVSPFLTIASNGHLNVHGLANGAASVVLDGTFALSAG